MNLRRLAVLPIVAILLSAPLRAQDAGDKSAGDQIQQIITEYRAAEQELATTFRAETDPDKKREITSVQLPKLRSETAEKLMKFANEKQLATAISLLTPEQMAKLAADSTSVDVKGVALFYQMQVAKGRELNEGNEAEVMPLMKRIQNEFADVELIDISGRNRGKLGSLVENELFAYENLRIGKEAPEIEGEDIDGVNFKLSDYRGKVVVIDFWGDW